jgi:hypothetical protein
LGNPSDKNSLNSPQKLNFLYLQNIPKVFTHQLTSLQPCDSHPKLLELPLHNVNQYFFQSIVEKQKYFQSLAKQKAK